ncbi:winged helix-turn-helix domain-containing protein [Stenotrophomonas maltophilia]
MANYPARNTDPDTSHDAAHHIVDSGARKAQQQRVAAAVRQHPGLTSRELADVAGMDRHMVARRLPELEADGVVVHGAPRKCRISEMRCQTWLPVLDRHEAPLAA